MSFTECTELLAFKDRRIEELTEGLWRLAEKVNAAESKLASALHEIEDLKGQVDFLERKLGIRKH